MRAARLVLCCLLISAVVPLVAAQESRWDNLSSIKTGTKIEVVEQSLKKTSGRFVRFSNSGLTLNIDSNDVSIPRAQIHRVTILGKNRKRNTVIGLGVAGALGAAWGGGLHAAGADITGGQAAAFAAGVAGIGAGIGAILPASKTVYRAERATRREEKEQSSQR